jgi:hypothetical protein
LNIVGLVRSILMISGSIPDIASNIIISALERSAIDLISLNLLVIET